MVHTTHISCVTAPFQPATINPENKNGHAHGACTFVKSGINPIFIETNTIKQDITGASTTGINIKGLKMIGRPKTNGSLMLKIAGIAAILLIAFKRVDFAMNNMEMIRPIVQPAPPIVAN